MSTKDIKIQKLDDPGKYLFVYSDKYNVFFIFQSKEDNKLYKITTDKLLNIEYIDEIITPNGFNDYVNIKFYKPYTENNNEHTFVGIVMFQDSSYTFKIKSNTYKLELNEKIDYVDNKQFNLLNCLKGIKITSYIQKKNKLYLVGVDEEHDDAIYGIVNMEEDCFENVHYIYTDNGEVVVNSINTDVEDERIYICGWYDITNNEGERLNQKPYFEMFTFK